VGKCFCIDEKNARLSHLPATRIPAPPHVRILPDTMDLAGFGIPVSGPGTIAALSDGAELRRPGGCPCWRAARMIALTAKSKAAERWGRRVTGLRRLPLCSPGRQ
jgi:hypothetical protein